MRSGESLFDLYVYFRKNFLTTRFQSAEMAWRYWRKRSLF